MGPSYSFFLYWRFIICTPAYSGEQDQGDAPKNKKQNVSNSTVTNLHLLSRPFWVGGLVALGLVACLFLDVPQAQAVSWTSSDLAKKVMTSVTPTGTNPDVSLASNETADNFVSKPFVAETVITPPDPPRQVLAASYYRAPVDYSLVAGPHYFPYGYCTYYVSQKRTIPWSGNAGTWLNAAKADEFSTGKDPKPGAIMVTSEGGRTGHVAYVESVNGSQFTVSEMNYKGYGIVSTRTISDGFKLIKGFIY